MSWRAFGEAFVTLVVIMDPLGSAPIFIALTAGRPRAARRRAALEAAAVAGGLVVLFALFGRLVLDYLHVSVESLAIAGGMLLLLVALQMLRGEEMAQPDTANVALVPLATPLLAGPGAIAAVMVLTRRYEDAPGRIGVILGIVAVVIVVAAGLLLADQIARLLRPSVIQLLTRVLGLLLSAIAVQFIIEDHRRALTDQEAGADRIIRCQHELMMAGQVRRALYLGDHRRVLAHPILPDDTRGEAATNDALVHQCGAAGQLATSIEERQSGGGPTAAR